MTAFPFRADRHLTTVLRESITSGRPTLSAEIIPPRNGALQAQVLGQVRQLVDAGAQFLSVTKGAGGSLRGGSLPIAQAVKEQFGVPCVAHFTCRDLTAHEIENQLIDHHYFGIRNILALRGDPPDGQPQWQARDGGYSYAYQLIEQIRALNSGRYLARPGGPAHEEATPTEFCIGAAAYPEHPVESERFEFFALKARAGAEYGITDLLFDADAYARFLDGLGARGIDLPILPGTRLLRTRGQAERMMKKFKVRVPAALLERLPETDGPEALKIGLDAFLELSTRLKSRGAPGIHLYVIIDTEGACAALRALAG